MLLRLDGGCYGCKGCSQQGRGGALGDRLLGDLISPDALGSLFHL